MKPVIAVVGTGRMGSALARAFLRRGYATHVWNRTRSRAEPLEAAGARLAHTPRDAADAADLVIVNLIDYETSEHVLGPVTAELRGKLLVQLTSGSSQDARRTAAWALEHGIQYLDGAIMATPDFIGEEACTVFYSGPEAAFNQHSSALQALAGRSLYLGSKIGLAAALDSALLALLWGNLFGVLQGAAICRVEEYSLEEYSGHIQASKPMLDGAVGDLIQRIARRNFGGEQSLATLEAHSVALRHLLTLCQEHGIHAAVPAAFKQLFQAAIDAGHAADDFAVLDRFMQIAPASG